MAGGLYVSHKDAKVKRDRSCDIWQCGMRMCWTNLTRQTTALIMFSNVGWLVDVLVEIGVCESNGGNAAKPVLVFFATTVLMLASLSHEHEPTDISVGQYYPPILDLHRYMMWRHMVHQYAPILKLFLRWENSYTSDLKWFNYIVCGSLFIKLKSVMFTFQFGIKFVKM